MRPGTKRHQWFFMPDENACIDFDNYATIVAFTSFSTTNAQFDGSSHREGATTSPKMVDEQPLLHRFTVLIQTQSRYSQFTWGDLRQLFIRFIECALENQHETESDDCAVVPVKICSLKWLLWWRSCSCTCWTRSGGFWGACLMGAVQSFIMPWLPSLHTSKTRPKS